MYCSIVDAILGALTLPDIGQLFPDNDPNWKGADSSIFMEEVKVSFIRFDCAPFIYFFMMALTSQPTRALKSCVT